MTDVPYQLTPAASKNNAFCWLTYPVVIDWRRTTLSAESQAARSEHIERQRAIGIDLLHIAGLGSQRMLDVRKLAITTPRSA